MTTFAASCAALFRPAVGALATLVAAAHCMPANADFGRLFFSIEERRALDAPPPPPSAPPPQAPPAPVPRRIDGILQRPDGRLLVWLDGIAESWQAANDAFRLHPSLALAPRSAPQLRLRIGDHWPPLPTADAARLLPAIQVHPAPEAAQ